MTTVEWLQRECSMFRFSYGCSVSRLGYDSTLAAASGSNMVFVERLASADGMEYEFSLASWPESTGPEESPYQLFAVLLRAGDQGTTVYLP